jgi:hypothetical protein
LLKKELTVNDIFHFDENYLSKEKENDLVHDKKK